MNLLFFYFKIRNIILGIKLFIEFFFELMLNWYIFYLFDFNIIDVWLISEVLNEFLLFDDNSLDEYEFENFCGMKR